MNLTLVLFAGVIFLLYISGMKTINDNTVWTYDSDTGKMVPDEFYNRRNLFDTLMCFECGADLTHGGTHYLVCSQSEI